MKSHSDPLADEFAALIERLGTKVSARASWKLACAPWKHACAPWVSAWGEGTWRVAQQTFSPPGARCSRGFSQWSQPPPTAGRCG